MEAIRNKYRGVKFMKVADLPELKGDVSVDRYLFESYDLIQALSRMASRKR